MVIVVNLAYFSGTAASRFQWWIAAQERLESIKGESWPWSAWQASSKLGKARGIMTQHLGENRSTGFQQFGGGKFVQEATRTYAKLVPVRSKFPPLFL